MLAIMGENNRDRPTYTSTKYDLLRPVRWLDVCATFYYDSNSHGQVEYGSQYVYKCKFFLQKLDELGR